MKVINLNGYSTKNIEEGETISKYLAEKGLNVYNHRWTHWDKPDVYMDFEIEMERIIRQIENGEQFVIVGKSIGSVIAAALIRDFNLTPAKAVLLGLPGISDLMDRTYIYNKAFLNRNIPVTIIQNKNDPMGGPDSFSKILKFKYELIVTEADTHRYLYPEKVYEVIDSK